MAFYDFMHWIHVLSMIVILGGYIFLAAFWLPVLRRSGEDVRVGCTSWRVRYALLHHRRAGPDAPDSDGRPVPAAAGLPGLWRGRRTGVGGISPHPYHQAGVGFVVALLVPMQLFGMAFRITRMDAGIYPLDAEAVQRVTGRMQVVSWIIIALLVLTVVLSMRL